MTPTGAMLLLASIAGGVTALAMFARIGWELGADVYNWILEEDTGAEGEEQRDA